MREDGYFQTKPTSTFIETLKLHENAQKRFKDQQNRKLEKKEKEPFASQDLS